MLRDNKSVRQSVSKERAELKDKTDRLHKFVMKSEDFKKLSPTHQLLLKKQLCLMIRTLEILDKRIKDLDRQIELEEDGYER